MHLLCSYFSEFWIFGFWNLRKNKLKEISIQISQCFKNIPKSNFVCHLTETINNNTK